MESDEETAAAIVDLLLVKKNKKKKKQIFVGKTLAVELFRRDFYKLQSWHPISTFVLSRLQ